MAAAGNSAADGSSQHLVNVDARPRIGVTLMTDTAKKDDHVPRFGMNRTYFEAIRGVGGIPVPLAPGDPAEMEIFLPAATDAARATPALDGLCLTGGGDPDARFFGQPQSPKALLPDLERDEMELRLLEVARRRRLPILGVCRGIQMLNIAWGGDLIQDIASARPDALKHDYWNGHPRDLLVHEIRIAPESRMWALFGRETVMVNSLHHQAIDRIGEGLVATAWAPDGIVEALEPVGPDGEQPDLRGDFVLGVQFHPEDLLADDTMLGIFGALVDAARLFRARRTRGSGR